MYLSRLAAAVLAIALSAPAFAGDVDSHFDRARGREAQARVRQGPPTEPRLDVDREAAQPAPTKSEPPALVAASTKGECTCSHGIRAK